MGRTVRGAHAQRPRPDGAVPPSVTRGLTFLAAAAAPGRWPHIVGHLEQILRQDPSVAVAAGSAALTALAETSLPASVLASVETCFPEFGQPDLDAGIATFTARLVAEHLPHTADPAERGRLHQGLGFRLGRAGRAQEALAADEEAAALFQDLAVTDAVTHETGLALALNNLGAFSWQLRRLPDAVAAQARAIEFARRGLAAGPPAGSLLARAFVLDESGLAQCLSNLSVLLWASRRREEAVTALEEAVATARQLAAVAPATQEPVLADIASRLVTYLGRLQR
ncbi:tetratricopeptide repeat protein [Streptomyces sp. NPDC059850]|uniref:tetratricopeptide repeat protein n=1 Tax=Streptomyces sp. NPDC059850 TaxID=3346970 RepID=UPI00364BDB0C